MYLFKVSKQSISVIVPDVCAAIVKVLSPYVKAPTTAEEWKRVATGFKTKWQFDHCIGALDGKHVVLQAPMHSGSEFFNYKGSHSIVLLALVDWNYSFLYVDVGCQGRISDGGVLKNSVLWQKLQTNIGLPLPEPLPGRDTPVPYVIVADDAFALHDNIMKPYPGHQSKGSNKRIFNYRLSRARRVSENAFGIMSSVFRVLRKPMLLSPEKASVITLSCVYLHNFLRASKSSSNIYAPPGSLDVTLPDGSIAPGDWRNDPEGTTSLLRIPRVGRKPTKTVAQIRDEYASFFVSDSGRVMWQDKYC